MGWTVRDLWFSGHGFPQELFPMLGTPYWFGSFHGVQDEAGMDTCVPQTQSSSSLA